MKTQTTLLTLLLTTLILISACANEEPIIINRIEQDSEPLSNGTQHSRLRLFGQNGTKVELYRNTACVKARMEEGDEKVSGGFGSALGSFLGTTSNTSVGIPETDTTRNLQKKNGILSKAYFREYVITSGKPVTVVTRFQDVSSFYLVNGASYSKNSPACGGAMTFVPRVGEDYEMSFNWNANFCLVGVSQIVQNHGATVLKLAKVYPALDCEGD